MSLPERVLTEEYMGDNVSDTEEASCVPNTSRAIYEAVEHLFRYATSRNLRLEGQAPKYTLCILTDCTPLITLKA
jgi:hypothetical protein